MGVCWWCDDGDDDDDDDDVDDDDDDDDDGNMVIDIDIYIYTSGFLLECLSQKLSSTKVFASKTHEHKVIFLTQALLYKNFLYTHALARIILHRRLYRQNRLNFFFMERSFCKMRVFTCMQVSLHYTSRWFCTQHVLLHAWHLQHWAGSSGALCRR